MAGFAFYPEDIAPSTAFPDGHLVRRPVALVGLSKGTSCVEPFYALLDTGADYCIFPSDYLEALKIDRASLGTAQVHGVGTDLVPFAEVTLSIAGLGEWPVKAGFSDLYKHKNFGFLGNRGFFDRFAVVFDFQNQECSIVVRKDD